MSDLIPWTDFPAYLEAKEKWTKMTDGLSPEELEELGSFESSYVFLQARIAYRRYANRSPDSETT